MVASGVYTEFYGADGVIKGKDYTGKWRVSGDTMCFQYSQDPEACWQVKLDGDKVTWVKGGKEDGTGNIIKGNPNNFWDRQIHKNWAWSCACQNHAPT